MRSNAWLTSISTARQQRMSLPTDDLPVPGEPTDPASTDTSRAVQAYQRPQAYGVPAKLTTPVPAASRVAVSPPVVSRVGVRPGATAGVRLPLPH